MSSTNDWSSLYSLILSWVYNGNCLPKFTSNSFAEVRASGLPCFMSPRISADRSVVLWCSGYHVCFTRRRSPVRSRPGPILILSIWISNILTRKLSETWQRSISKLFYSFCDFLFNLSVYKLRKIYTVWLEMECLEKMSWTIFLKFLVYNKRVNFPFSLKMIW